MHRTALLLLSLTAVFAVAPGAPAETPPSTDAINTDAISADTPRNFDFSGESVSVVLLKLGRAAKMNIAVADSVEGVVNMRIEGKTPREAMMMIVESQNLVFKEVQRGLFYIRPKNPAHPGHGR
jgi:hypothetical protein